MNLYQEKFKGYIRFALISICLILIPMHTNPLSATIDTQSTKINTHALKAISLGENNKHFSDTLVSFNNNSKVKQLKHEEIVSLMELFMNQLVQKTNDNYQVLNYNSKQELIERFMEFTSYDVAKKFIDFYYKENENKLFIVPTETPPPFEKDSSYEQEQIADDHIRIVQENTEELYGSYVINIDFYFDNLNGWKLEDISYQQEL